MAAKIKSAVATNGYLLAPRAWQQQVVRRGQAAWLRGGMNIATTATTAVDALWKRLSGLAHKAASRSILSLFDVANRAAAFSCTAGDMRLDFSKTSIDAATLEALLALAHATGVEAQRDAMFAGALVNRSENRAALHMALRDQGSAALRIDGADVLAEVRATRARMERLSMAVRTGQVHGQGGAYTDVINIGIGGSDLGPAMAVRALRPWADGPRCHFLSNVDGAHLTDIVAGLNPATTLVIVASKTMTTIETMTNARSIRAWMAPHVADPAAQFVAVSSASEKALQFGIPPERTFGFADWVGGRYSVWGPIGLPVMLSIGERNFAAFLAGAAEVDAHFQEAPLAKNMPVLLALTGIWHNQLLGYCSRAVVPYDQRLELLPAYLQQLEMESNGKSVRQDGVPLAHQSAPVVWGEPGTNGQHAFFQLLHQGSRVVPVEFLLAARGNEGWLAHHHDMLVANCLAQSAALMRGRNLEEARSICAAEGMAGPEVEAIAHQRSFPGNRPSTTLLYPQLTPRSLGQIIALYEHRVFVEGAILGINSFDQWGVELGKELAQGLLDAVTDRTAALVMDGSTRALLDHVAVHRHPAR